MNVNIIIHKDKDGYWAEVPALKGCFSQGNTKEELLENLKEAISGWLATAESMSTKNVGNFEVMSIAV